jgi:hypothetical protein
MPVLPTPWRCEWIAWAGLLIALAEKQADAAETPKALAPAPCITPEAARADLQRKAAPKLSGPTAGMQVSGYAQRELGLFAGVAMPDERKSSGPLVMVGERGLAWLAAGPLSARYSDEFAIGRAPRGWAYWVAADVTLGGRLRITPNQGPIARLGLGAGVERTADVYLSRLTLPVAEIGYQIASKGRTFDAIAHAAPLVLGHVATEQARGRLRGLSWGGALGLTLAPLVVDLRWTQLSGVSRQSLVGQGRANMCILLGKRPPRARRRTGDVNRPVFSGSGAADYVATLCAFSRAVALERRQSPVKISNFHYAGGISLAFGVHSLVDPAP